MSMTVPVGRRANERQSKDCSFLVVFFSARENGMRSAVQQNSLFSHAGVFQDVHID